jgi:Protein of unknown function (DUF2490)
MKIFAAFLFIAPFLLSISCFAQQSPYTKDFQIWSDVQITVPLLKGKDNKQKSFDKIDIVFDGIARFGRDVTYPVDDRLSASLEFRINKYLKIAPGYLYQRTEIVPKIKNYETRLTLAGLFEKKFDNFTFKHRSLFEYRLRNSRSDTKIYRSRFNLSHPFKSREKELFSVFVSEEPFYDFTNKIWRSNEFFAGITRKINKNLTTDVFYLNLGNKTGLPRRANGFGINFKIRID